MMTGGIEYLLGNLPDAAMPNIYYWYYATPVMHNMGGYEWDTWNRKMRMLMRTQVRSADHCANGSWDPEGDAWAVRGPRDDDQPRGVDPGIPYRFLPLFEAEARE